MAKEKIEIARESFVMGVTGASGSAKTTTAERIKEKLEKVFPGLSVCILTLDNYYNGKGADETFLDYTKRNLEIPKEFNWQLFKADLLALKKGENIYTPFYDMVNDSVSYPKKIFLAAADIIIVEGILLFTQPEVKALMDFTIYTQLASGLCLARRQLRDAKERSMGDSYTLPNYESKIYAAYRLFTKPLKLPGAVDFILKTEKRLEDNEQFTDLLVKLTDKIRARHTVSEEENCGESEAMPVALSDSEAIQRI